MKNILTIVFLLIIQNGYAQHGQDTIPSKVVSKILLEQILDRKDLKNNIVRIETVTFAPNYSSPKHTHPCPLFVYMIEGELLSEFEGVKKIYKAGDSFYEKANGVHSITQNISSINSAKILVIYLMKEDMNTFKPFTH